MFRLHIDVPLCEDQELSAEQALAFLAHLKESLKDAPEEIKGFQYRMTSDNDRSANNYLDKDDNGHCRNKKSKL